MRTSKLPYLALAVLLSFGCKGTNPNGTDQGSGVDQGQVDQGPVDLGPDVGPVDLGPDVGPVDLGPDLGPPDLGPPDLGVLPPDGGVPDPDPVPPECMAAGNVDLCNPGCPLTTACDVEAMVDTCPSGFMCAGDGCGGVDDACIPMGHPCVDASDCPSGSTCTQRGMHGTFCDNGGATCTESRDCPMGFMCESGACVDRRLFCEPDGDPCPIGFMCEERFRLGQAFCRVIDQPCANSEVCPQPGLCFDHDGDGQTECVPTPTCTIDTCGAGVLCGNQPDDPKGYTCGSQGSCLVQNCEMPLTCIDVRGDGRPECVFPEATCTSHAECEEPEVCALLEGAPFRVCTNGKE